MWAHCSTDLLQPVGAVGAAVLGFGLGGWVGHRAAGGRPAALGPWEWPRAGGAVGAVGGDAAWHWGVGTAGASAL